MQTLLISPYSRRLRNGKRNPKNYPYWEEVIVGVRNEVCSLSIAQLGLEGEEKLNGVDTFLKGLSIESIKKLLRQNKIWCSVDNFFPHLAHRYSNGVVLYGKSNPSIFGYSNCINLYKDISYFRKDQFDVWESEEYSAECFVEPIKVVQALIALYGKILVGEQTYGTI